MLLLLLAATVVLAPIAERISIPYPVLLLIFGLLLAFVPGLPLPSVNPELLLPLVLPPLLFAAARRTSWRQFLDNRRPIASARGRIGGGDGLRGRFDPAEACSGATPDRGARARCGGRAA